MRADRIFRAIGLIDDKFLDIAENTPAREPVSREWVKWVSIAACLVLVFSLGRGIFRTGSKTTDSATSGSYNTSTSTGSMMGNNSDTVSDTSNEGTTSDGGEELVSAAVMVSGVIYEWDAECDALPENAVFYGEIVCVDASVPENDCELASEFDVTGEIYTSDSDDAVYLVVTTDWLEETVIRFTAK